MKHNNYTLFILTIALAMLGCSGGSSGSGPTGGGVQPTPTVTPTNGITPPGDGDTVVIGDPGLCNAGDVARVDFTSGGKARFSLVSSTTTCSPAKDNRKEEYTLILYNTTASAMSFRLDTPLSEIPPATQALRRSLGQATEPNYIRPPKTKVKYNVGRNSMDAEADALYQLNPPNKFSYYQRKHKAAARALTTGDEVAFKVRSNPSDDDVFLTTSAILRAQGTHINLFIDRDIPFGGINADSPTQLQLDNIVTIFEQNIHPLEVALLGNPSDVDADGRVNVLVTPIVNKYLKVASYTDSRNVLPFDPVSNPGSNESEMIFVYAPDSLGNYDLQGNGVDATEYINKILNAWISFSYSKIISYNQHVLVSDGSAEDDWIADGIGAVMADLAGFNIWRPAVYTTLAQPQLDDLRKAESLDYVSFEGAEYLFMTYFMQSQVDSTAEDSNSDGFDDDLSVFSRLMTSGLTGESNLENAVDFTFDEDIETEFQSIFKDWTIAVTTSGTNRTDLQQSGQDAVKYFLTLNPASLGSGITAGAGSVRVGADGGALDPSVGANAVGIDLNNYHTEESTLIENADEHVFAPGNPFFGFIDPYSAMYVRLSGLFRQSQIISVLGSSSSLKGFLVKRSNITYPHTYSESIFSSVDQHPEDMETAGPNPYWTGQGFAKKIDMLSLYNSTTAGNISQDFLSIVGSIDTPTQVKTCPEDIDACSAVDVPDTDKYLITIPDNGGRTDDGDWIVTVRRQFDEGSDEAELVPVLALVSSKDVPYPYLPHPIRDSINGVGTTDTRQQYRWITSQLICGDDQAGGDTGLSTNLPGGLCAPAVDEDSPKISIAEGSFIENTGALEVTGGDLFWDGDVLGGECNATPDLSELFLGTLNQISTTGYGASNAYPVTDAEVSPSSMGGYSWTSGGFMELAYDGSNYPDVMFARDFLMPSPGYPSIDPEAMYDPRSINSTTLNCHVLTTGDPDTAVDSPDDVLTPGELSKPTTLAEQILVEMSRSRFASDGTPEASRLASKYDDNDIFAINGDSRDLDTVCTQTDIGNNMNPFTVRSKEGGILWANYNFLEPHIKDNLNNSSINQTIFANPSLNTRIQLTPGKSYTIIVGGVGNTVGNYEIRLRKMNPTRINEQHIALVDANTVECDREL